jgi:4-coumarate--CoA ligase
MIKVKGIQVAPVELEELLSGFEGVEDCAVVGVRDDYSGERPFGFVVLKDGMKRDGIAEEIMALVRERKVRTKWLSGVRVLEAIPKSASGKILRRVLRDGLERECQQMKGRTAKL